MNMVLQRPWTAEQFLTWAARQEGRYEFDGIRPVAMTGGSADHSRIALNIQAALRSRLRGTPCSSFGPDLAVRTVGEKVRSPDGLITCTKFTDTARVAPDVVVIFEVLSPDSGRRDRIVKLQEYAAVPSIRRYVILEYLTKGILVLHRARGEDPWTALGLTADDILPIPEVGIEIPVAEFYEDVDLPETEEDGGT
jgi:Uma2 family endonuclease